MHLEKAILLTTRSNQVLLLTKVLHLQKLARLPLINNGLDKIKNRDKFKNIKRENTMPVKNKKRNKGDWIRNLAF